MTTKDLVPTNTEIEPVSESNGKAPVSPRVEMISEADLQKALEKDAKSQVYHKEYNSRPEVIARNKERQDFGKEERRVISLFKKGTITGEAARTQIAALEKKYKISR